jgi:hypothetical protein
MANLTWRRRWSSCQNEPVNLTSVRNELKSQPMTTADLVEVKPCGLLGSDDGVGGDEYDGLGQLVDNYEDSVEAAAWGEGHDEVH